MTKLHGWGRFQEWDCQVHAPASEQELIRLVRSGDSLIARGCGRAYGDSAINPACTIDMRRLNRVLSFEQDSGLLTAEAGAMLGDLIAQFLPHGWFFPVTPGTKFVTLGGMAAADVHGKNHHRVGSLGRFVEWIELIDAHGRLIRASPSENPRLFEWTLGGMGLTGIIARLAVRLQPVETGWIRQKCIRSKNLGETLDAFDAHDDSTYSVAWIDSLGCGAHLGRSVLLLGEHARRDELPDSLGRRPFDVPGRSHLSVPFNLPKITLNRLTLKAFNALYFHAGGRAQWIDWDRYFYPLDALHNWNRLYGSAKLVQFQCVLPLEQSRAGLAELLQAIASSGQGSFLSVLKRFGSGKKDGAENTLSFPMSGYTLALDFPATPGVLKLLNQLDEIVLSCGGHFYLAKDARMSAQSFARSEHRLEAFRQFRSSCSAAERFSSMQSERLGL